jgi:toxin ParE1/3/4
LNWTVTASPAAESEIAEAIDWYESKSAGLGGSLLEEIQRLRTRLATNPFQFPLIHRESRRASLRRFPHILIFLVEDREVRLLAFFHTRRNPERWRSRIR